MINNFFFLYLIIASFLSTKRGYNKFFRRIIDKSLIITTRVWGMVLILDGNPELGAQVRSNLVYLICLRHSIRSRAVTNQIFFSENAYFPSSVAHLSYHVI